MIVENSFNYLYFMGKLFDIRFCKENGDIKEWLCIKNK